MWVCLKTEELRWGSPTATPPFEPFVQPVPELVKGAQRSFVRNERRMSLVLAPRLRCLLLFYCLQAHPLCWVVLLFTLASFKNKRPMERSPWALKSFINLNQDVFLFPENSVLIRGKCFCLFFFLWLCYFCFLNICLFRICRRF